MFADASMFFTAVTCGNRCAYVYKQEIYEEVEVIKPKKLCLRYNVSDGIIHDAVKKIFTSASGRTYVPMSLPSIITDVFWASVL